MIASASGLQEATVKKLRSVPEDGLIRFLLVREGTMVLMHNYPYWTNILQSSLVVNFREAIEFEISPI